MDSYRLAKHFLQDGNFEESFKLLTAFIDSQKDVGDSRLVADALNTRGHIRYLWVHFKEAIADYTEAINMDPMLSIAYYNRGQVQYRLGHLHLAEKDLVKSLELNQDFTDARLNLQQVQSDLMNGHEFNTEDKHQ